MGVSGVPFFIFGGRVGVPGAQEPSVLRQAIAQARQEMAEAADGATASA
jgi:predicted DsbA family dithiol-disulfide isomerase